MHWNTDFELAGFILLCLFLAYHYISNRFPSKLNHLFEQIMFITLLSMAVNMVSIFSRTYAIHIPIVYNYMLTMLYFLLLQLDALFIFRYIFQLTKPHSANVIKKAKFFVYIPFCIAALLIITTPLTHLLFYFDAENQYIRGQYIVLLYILAFSYIFTGFILTQRKNMILSKSKYTTIYFLIGLLCITGILQNLLPDILLVGFSCSIGCLFIHLFLQNPSDTIDMETGLFNRNAFLLSVDEAIQKKEPFTVISISPDDIGKISETYGLVLSDKLLLAIAKAISHMDNINSCYRLDSSLFALFIKKGIAEYDDVLSQVENLFSSPWELTDTISIPVTACICSLNYPKNVSRTEEITDMIEVSMSKAKNIGKGTILHAQKYILTREQKITELESQKIALKELSYQAQLEKEEAEQAAQAKTLFLANMSHEIRTPLNAILGMTELILRDNISDRTKSHATHIKNAGTSLLHIINEILDFSKIESGKMELLPDSYALDQTLDNIINIIRIRMAAKDIDFLVEINPEIPKHLWGDAYKIHQVLINLLTNALKFTSEGYIYFKVDYELHTEETLLSDDDATSEEDKRPPNMLLKIEITDTGCGIKEEDMHRLFRSFERFDSKRNRTIEGTGLGLAICKQIIDLMNGNIDVKSIYGKGTSFFLTIPQSFTSREELVVLDNSSCHAYLFYGSSLLHGQFENALSSIGVFFSCSQSVSGFHDILYGETYTHIFIEESVFYLIRQLVDNYNGNKKIIMIGKEEGLISEYMNINMLNLPIHCMNLAQVLGETSPSLSVASPVPSFTAPNSRLLIVDDTPINLEIAVSLLDPLQLQTDTAASGKEALSLVEKHQYDMIFLDHMMPEMDGIETLHAIRACGQSYTKTVPIIAFTANAVEGVKEMFLGEGFQNFLSKPVDINQLNAMILEYLPKENIIKTEKTPENPHNVSPNPSIQSLSGSIGKHTIEYDMNAFIDYRKGLEICGGNSSVYEKILTSFTQNYESKKALLLECIEKKDWERYTIEVHGLKSASKSIGALPLAEKFAEQEAFAGNGAVQKITESFETVLQEYKKVTEGIYEYLHPYSDGLATLEQLRR